MHRLSYILVTTLLFYIFSCAKTTSPTGGPKDTIPPYLTDSRPIKGAINIKPKTIRLEFTEAVVLNNPKEQLLITPDLNKKYSIEANNKTIEILLETELLENTTYLFNFRDAVQDRTEKNPVRDLKLAFSTGPFIDSLQLEGTIKDLFKNQIAKDITVALYESDTFNIFRHRPKYITRTNEKGRYRFEYLKNATYYIYAFDDKNKNLLTDSKSENFGFQKAPIKLTKNARLPELNLIRLDSRPQRLTSTRPYNTYTTINFLKGLKQYTLSNPDYDTIFSTYGETTSTIQLYNTFNNEDSLAIRIQAIDSLEHRTDTTLYVKFSKRQTTPEKFTTGISDVRLIQSKGILTAKGTFSKPIKAINPDSMFIRIDSVTSLPIKLTDINVNNRTRQLTIKSQFGKNAFPQPTPVQPDAPPKKIPLEIRFAKGTFISVENDSSTAIKQNVQPLREEDLGMIKIKVETSQKNYILELLTKDYKPIAAVNNPSTFSFTDLTPGDYIIRITHDLNGDGVWSPGNFHTKNEPEPFTYYLNEKKSPIITLKANWEIGPLLIKF